MKGVSEASLNSKVPVSEPLKLGGLLLLSLEGGILEEKKTNYSS